MKVILLTYNYDNHNNSTTKLYIRLPKFSIPSKIASAAFSGWLDPSSELKVFRDIEDPDEFIKVIHDPINKKALEEVDCYLEVFDTDLIDAHKTITNKFIKSILLKSSYTLGDYERFYSLVSPDIIRTYLLNSRLIRDERNIELTLEEFLGGENSNIDKKILWQIINYSI